MFDNWKWPQWAMASLMLLTLFAKIYLDGKTITVNGFAGLSDFLIIWIILYFGGFWK